MKKQHLWLEPLFFILAISVEMANQQQANNTASTDATATTKPTTSNMTRDESPITSPPVVEVLTYSTYLKLRQSCAEAIRCPCWCTRERQKRTKAGRNLYPLGVSTTTIIGKKILRGRRAHAFGMIILTMTIIPFTVIIARYFKETWFSNAFAGFIHLWYLIHIGLALLGLGVFAFSLNALSHGFGLLGRSETGVAFYHAGLGYTALIIFLVVIISGPLRPVNLFGRKWTMIGHAVIGLLLYILGLITLLLSSYIPGSPSVDPEVCIDDPDFVSKSTSILMFPVFWWIAADISAHVILTRLQQWADYSLKMTRKLKFPLVPILPIDCHHDMRGFRYRKLVLILYGIVNAITVGTILIRVMVENEEAGCGFGAMTCTNSKVDGKLLDVYTCATKSYAIAHP